MTTPVLVCYYFLPCLLNIHNRISGTVYCRILMTRQTALAHQYAFEIVESIVEQDTKRCLQWRHIHATTVDETIGILGVTLDQHGGQAKGAWQSFCCSALEFIVFVGFGLHLKALAQKLPQKYDLHEPHRLLSSLDEYNHLCRILRLCVSHIFRNIRKAAVAETVRDDMRSLVCMSHPDWAGTISRIERDGGQPGTSESVIHSPAHWH